MSKTKTSFFCQNCGTQSPKWLGKCPSCNTWNTFVEEVIEKPSQNNPTTSFNNKKRSKAQLITDVNYESVERTSTSIEELDRVLGGGIVPGSLTLFGGEPGIGKSTLLLQAALSIKAAPILYISGEESESQVKMRADRLEGGGDALYILTETNTKNIFIQIDEIEPSLLIIDSIQVLHSPLIESTPGSISQVRQCTAELMKFAKEGNVPVFIIGHINKDGNIAGPKVLEHMVDTVLQFEGDRNLSYRILRTLKNRFGSTAELGIFEMQSNGLREVTNASELLITQKDEPLSGISIAVSVEGNRPLLLETQALVSPATYGTPQRACTGFDTKRLNMLLAVLEKRCGCRLSAQDVFLNIAGGLKVEGTATDLSICAAIVSSYEEIAIPIDTCFVGEVGLGGEIRAVNRIEDRVAEAKRLGYVEVIISKYNNYSQAEGIRIVEVGKITELISYLFG